MDFQGKGRPLSPDGMSRVCEHLDVPEPEVWAVITVETSGFGFLEDRRPQILFERHIFRRLTDGRHDAGNSDVSNRKAGGYVGGAAEYERLKKAANLDREAALKSTSWGISQVMGFNHGVAGFDDVESMVEAMIRNEDEQLLAMAKFIEGNGLARHLKHRSWASFARGYNGPDYKKNDYDTRLAAAHAKYSTLMPDLSLRTAQAALRYLGYKVGPVDGIRGRRTRSALLDFQEQNGLTVTGELDETTEQHLLSEVFPE